MADFDPDANVPLWLNITVPLVCVAMFVLVVVTLYRTKRECDIITLENIVESIPFINKCLLQSEDASGENKNVGNVGNTDKGARTNDAFSVDIYDTLSSVRTYGTLESDATSASSSRSSFYGRPASAVRFESNV